MKTSILILSLTISLVSCKDKALKPQRSAGIDQENTKKYKPFSGWRIKPLGYNYDLTYAVPYVNYVGRKNIGC